MKVFLLILLSAALAVPPLAAQKTVNPPVIVKRGEPDYAGLTSGYAVDFTTVDMVIDSHGIPFSLEAAGSSLPNNVVEALALWVYEPATEGGKAVSFSVRLVVPVRRAITAQLARAFQRSWGGRANELQEQIKAGSRLDAAGAGKLENRLKSSPDDVGARSRLLACYAGEAGGLNAPELVKARARHIAWLVANHPDAEILGGPLALINVSAGPLADADGFREVRQIWLDQIRKNPSNMAILGNAVNFLRIADFEKAEALLTAVRGKHRMSHIWLGDLYGLAALGVNGIDLNSGLPVSSKPYVDFMPRAKVILAQTNDAKVLLSGLATFTAGGHALEASGQLPAAYASDCAKLLERARTVYADAPATCESTVAPADPKESSGLTRPTTIRVGGIVMASKLVKQPKPSYPSVAKQLGIQGTVRFNVVIGKQGTMDSVELVSGPLALYVESRDSVRRSKYNPTTVNGEPVEVLSTVDVNFALSQ